MPTRNISLPETLDRFVEDALKSGCYDNASEVVRAGLRLLEQEEKENQTKLETLKAALAQGMASGSEDADIVFAELDEYLGEIVAGKKADHHLVKA